MSEKKVAFITGFARGQGRAHAVKLVEAAGEPAATEIFGPVLLTFKFSRRA
jgi:hypothetical protein